jgi:predicted nucleic acid-binding Zn ribbon protein
MTPATPPTPVAEPTHGCVRCGASIPIDASMCEECNPLGLKAPSASQAHGIAFLGIGVAVVIMAVVARFAIAGIGPFYSTVTNVTPAGGALRVTVALTNQGSAAGSTTCRIDDPAERGIGPEAQFFESPQVQPGKTLLFDVVVTSLGSQARPLAASCS